MKLVARLAASALVLSLLLIGCNLKTVPSKSPTEWHELNILRLVVGQYIDSTGKSHDELEREDPIRVKNALMASNSIGLASDIPVRLQDYWLDFSYMQGEHELKALIYRSDDFDKEPVISFKLEGHPLLPI